VEVEVEAEVEAEMEVKWPEEAAYTAAAAAAEEQDSKMQVESAATRASEIGVESGGTKAPPMISMDTPALKALSGSKATEAPPEEKGGGSEETWECPNCEFMNFAARDTCLLCGTEQPAHLAEQKEINQQLSVQEDLKQRGFPELLIPNLPPEVHRGKLLTAFESLAPGGVKDVFVPKFPSGHPRAGEPQGEATVVFHSDAVLQAVKEQGGLPEDSKPAEWWNQWIEDKKVQAPQPSRPSDGAKGGKGSPREEERGDRDHNMRRDRDWRPPYHSRDRRRDDDRQRRGERDRSPGRMHERGKGRDDAGKGRDDGGKGRDDGGKGRDDGGKGSKGFWGDLLRDHDERQDRERRGDRHSDGDRRRVPPRDRSPGRMHERDRDRGKGRDDGGKGRDDGRKGGKGFRADEDRRDRDHDRRRDRDRRGPPDDRDRRREERDCSPGRMHERDRDRGYRDIRGKGGMGKGSGKGNGPATPEGASSIWGQAALRAPDQECWYASISAANSVEQLMPVCIKHGGFFDARNIAATVIVMAKIHKAPDFHAEDMVLMEKVAKALQKRAVDVIASATPQHMTDLLSAMGSLAIAPDPAFMAALERQMLEGGLLNRFEAQQLTQFLSALASIATNPNCADQPVSHQLKTSLVACAGACIYVFSPHDVALFLDSAVDLELVLPVNVSMLLMQWALQVAGKMSAQDVIRTLVAMAKLGLPGSRELQQALTQQAAATCQMLGPEELTQLVEALDMLKIQVQLPFLQNVVAHVAKLITIDKFSTAHATRLYAALANLEPNPNPMVSGLLHRLGLELLPLVSALELHEADSILQACSVLYQSHKQDQRAGREIIGALCKHVVSLATSKEFGTKQVSTIMAALSKLRFQPPVELLLAIQTNVNNLKYRLTAEECADLLCAFGGLGILPDKHSLEILQNRAQGLCLQFSGADLARVLVSLAQFQHQGGRPPHPQFFKRSKDRVRVLCENLKADELLDILSSFSFFHRCTVFPYGEDVPLAELFMARIIKIFPHFKKSDVPRLSKAFADMGVQPNPQLLPLLAEGTQGGMPAPGFGYGQMGTAAAGAQYNHSATPPQPATNAVGVPLLQPNQSLSQMQSVKQPQYEIDLQQQQQLQQQQLQQLQQQQLQQQQLQQPQQSLSQMQQVQQPQFDLQQQLLQQPQQSLSQMQSVQQPPFDLQQLQQLQQPQQTLSQTQSVQQPQFDLLQQQQQQQQSLSQMQSMQQQLLQQQQLMGSFQQAPQMPAGMYGQSTLPGQLATSQDFIVPLGMQGR